MAATVWKGYISFGLVSFPVRLTVAARPDPVRFHMLHKKDLSRIREVFYCAAEDKPVPRGEIIKGYEVDKDHYIPIEPADLEKITPATAGTMEILQFVRSEEVDPIFLATSYYVAPDQAVSKPYALLLQAMKETKYDGIGKVTMHGREHIVVLRPTNKGFVLHTMYFVDELHQRNKAEVSSSAPGKKELALARKLIEALAAPFEPTKFRDDYKSAVLAMIEKKRNGEEIAAPKKTRKAPVIDLMRALQRSLSQGASSSKPVTTGKSARARSRVA